MRKTAAEDIRIHAAEGSSGGRETITRDRTPKPRERGGGEEERVSMSSSWAGYRRRARCASSARAPKLAAVSRMPSNGSQGVMADVTSSVSSLSPFGEWLG